MAPVTLSPEEILKSGELDPSLVEVSNLVNIFVAAKVTII